jgi:hypothetical protein
VGLLCVYVHNSTLVFKILLHASLKNELTSDNILEIVGEYSTPFLCLALVLVPLPKFAA